ncbi:hypothetical protein [Kribbella sp. NPDC004875]|uniref:hypothetical protein n=1 Tax=Kribbella sp. NPDC004875 TaxID=3364107 RepID=UPI003673C4D3
MDSNGWPESVAVSLSFAAISQALWDDLAPTLRVAIVTVRLDEDTFANADVRSR